MNRVRREGAGGKAEFGDWGQFILTLGSQEHGSFGELFLSISPPACISSRAAMNFIKCLVPVSIHPLHNIWLHRYLGKASGGSPSLSLLAPPLPPPMLLAYPPIFVLSSEVWLSEWRKMCVLQVLLQHSTMRLPKEIPRGTL